MIEHEQLLNSSLARLNYYPADSETRLLLLPSFAFDAFGAGFYLVLMTGGILYLPQNPADVEQLVTIVRAEKITHLLGTPTLYQELLRQMPSALTRLRVVIIGGEAASSTLLQEHFGKMPQAGLFNEYGPTEATIWTTVCRYQTAEQATNIIGKPVANTRIHILNAEGQPLPVSIAGELCIAGENLARGYLNQPELTAEKFSEVELFGQRERIYKTGDLVRWLSNGNLEFLGRIDNQVKLRGFRIELGEIESLLTQHPAVHEAVVILYEGDGNKRLVAYLTGQQESLAVDELRNWLKTRLPEYMIPAQFIVLDKLPLTPNGKIDRKALPSPELNLMDIYEAPRNAIEQQLSEIWSVLFKRQNIGIHDNFFNLGGNSILSIQMVVSCQQAGLQFTPSDLFEQQTIARLANVLSKTQAVKTDPVPRTGHANLPLSLGQYRMWLKQTAHPDQTTFNISDCFLLTGRLDKAALQHSIDEIIRRHEILRTVFPLQNGNPVQFILPATSATIIFKDFGDLPENRQMAAVETWAKAQMRQPCDLVNGPLLHIYLMQLTEQSHILLFCLHHLITDMVSQGIFMDELLSLYSATVVGKPSLLPALPIQFADYALWQRQTLTGDALEKRLNYWRAWLAKGEPPVLPLPADRERVTPKSLEAGMEMYQLPPELVKNLKSLSQRNGATLYSVFLTALSALLYNYSDCDDIVIASPVANRTHSVLERLIGLIGSMLVLRIDLSDNPSFSTLLTEVQQRVLAAIAHQDQPFEEAIKILQPERQRNMPVARVLLNLLPESPNKQFHLPELTLSPLPLSEAEMNLDLVLAFWEEDDGLSGWWRYRKDIFDPETIGRIHQDFQTVLQAMVTKPEQRVNHLALNLTIYR
jgi:non-ribosomal peptide synthetase component F